eukprot:CAMPEP_0170506004 /NCGR_PEP_ID=MMETSP0208-20121228/53149_1 /TAXON_ID=197538 /ORGANISM="Strombidium inclinatum, Strain S3" /LENGTH=37 /DNA_ID= /DNA_START= /DNA_END= /DNA_ORIENTATION=
MDESKIGIPPVSPIPAEKENRIPGMTPESLPTRSDIL